MKTIAAFERKRKKEETDRSIKTAHDMGYKKYDRVCNSLANRANKTGVQRVPALEKAISGKAHTTRSDANRADKCRLSCWLSNTIKSDFDASRAYRGFTSDKDYIVYLIQQDAGQVIFEKNRDRFFELGGVENGM